MIIKIKEGKTKMIVNKKTDQNSLYELIFNEKDLKKYISYVKSTPNYIYFDLINHDFIIDYELLDLSKHLNTILLSKKEDLETINIEDIDLKFLNNIKNSYIKKIYRLSFLDDINIVKNFFDNYNRQELSLFNLMSFNLINNHEHLLMNFLIVDNNKNGTCDLDSIINNLSIQGKLEYINYLLPKNVSSTSNISNMAQKMFNGIDSKNLINIDQKLILTVLKKCLSNNVYVPNLLNLFINIKDDNIFMSLYNQAHPNENIIHYFEMNQYCTVIDQNNLMNYDGFVKIDDNHFYYFSTLKSVTSKYRDTIYALQFIFKHINKTIDKDIYKLMYKNKGFNIDKYIKKHRYNGTVPETKKFLLFILLIEKKGEILSPLYKRSISTILDEISSDVFSFHYNTNKVTS